MKRASYTRGFSIVEIIVVVVVLGILASVIVIGYGAWQASLGENVVKSDLRSAASAMEDARTWEGATGYPSTIPSTFVASDKVTVTKFESDSGYFCLQGTHIDKPGVIMRVSSKNADPVVGACGVVVETVAGTGVNGLVNGSAASSRFSVTTDVTVDSSGNIYVADAEDNNRIRKITSSGVVSTFAGSGVSGFADGSPTSARFSYPSGIAVDASGTVYVSDLYNNRIRKITSSGVVSTLAGSGVAGSADGVGTGAQFNVPGDVTVDASSVVYAVDGIGIVRKITPNGIVTTIAQPGVSGWESAPPGPPQYGSLTGIAVSKSGFVYVSDAAKNIIRKITPNGGVSTFAGSGSPGTANGVGVLASFDFPAGLVIDSDGVLYVADYYSNRIRKITPNGTVTTLAGTGADGFVDGAAATAQFSRPRGLGIDSKGSIYVADGTNFRIRKIQIP